MGKACLQSRQVQIEAEFVHAAADQTGLAVPAHQAAGKGVRLCAATAEHRREAAAAVFQGGVRPRQALCLAQALLQSLRL